MTPDDGPIILNEPTSDETDSEKTDHTLVSSGLPSTRTPGEDLDDEPTRVKRDPIRVLRARSETPPSSRGPELPPSSRSLEVRYIEGPPSSSPAVELSIEPRQPVDSSVPVGADAVEPGARPFSASPEGLPRLWLTRSALKLPQVTDLEDTDSAPQSTTVSAAVDRAVSRARAERAGRGVNMRMKQRQRWGVIAGAFLVGCLLTGGLVTLLVGGEKVTLTLDVQPAGAKVYVDGQDMTGTVHIERPCAAPVTLRVEAPGHKAETQQIPCGETVRMVIRLEKQ